MEIRRTNIPQLQSAISSGLASVTKGIAQSTKVSGSGALEKALESFSTAKLGISGADQWLAVSGAAESHAADLPGPVGGNDDGTSNREFADLWIRFVSSVAEYPDPVTVLRSMPEVPVQSEAPVSARDLLQTLQDPSFRPEVALSGGPLKDLRSVVEALRSFDDRLQSEDQMSNFQIQPLQSEFGNASPTFRPGADASVLKPTVKDLASDGSLAGYGSAYYSAKELQPGVDSPNRLAATAASSDADQRGIIIIGGKTEGTYFQTIDDTLSQLQTNPEPQGVQLLQQQVAAVKDMASTAEQVVRLQQRFFSGPSGKIQG